MNNGLLYLGGLLTVILAALFGVPYFVDWNGYRGVFDRFALLGVEAVEIRQIRPSGRRVGRHGTRRNGLPRSWGCRGGRVRVRVRQIEGWIFERLGWHVGRRGRAVNLTTLRHDLEVAYSGSVYNQAVAAAMHLNWVEKNPAHLCI